LFFLIKKPETETEPVQTDRFRFDFVILGKKPVQTGLTRFFPGLARFFSVWLGFFGFGSVWFFQFQAYKTKTDPNRLVFFKILISLIGFFSRFGFFGLIGFLVFLLTPKIYSQRILVFSRFNFNVFSSLFYTLVFPSKSRA
jgi:hypothetical protein